MTPYVSEETLEAVRRTARDRCGYCLAPQSLVYAPLEVDHIVPHSRHGGSNESNLWLACPYCNNAKGAQIEGTDPKSGERVRLFNPRRDHWGEHFRWSVDGAEIAGITSIGRATVVSLRMNERLRRETRLSWVQYGQYPPQDMELGMRVSLRISGLVEGELNLTFSDLSAVDPADQILDVSQIAEGRKGGAIKLSGLLKLAGVKPEAKWLGLHASRDDFHASIPLDQVRERAFLIYRIDGQPLPEKAGGPCRFFIQDYLACHSADVDECANVKFVDHIELTAEKGHDNRPHDDAAHAALHQKEMQG